MNIQTIRAAIGLCAASLVLAGCSGPEAPAAAIPPRTVSVVAAASSDTVTRASLTGEVKAQVQQDLAFRTAGRVLDVLVETGDHVVAGQPLARLDAADQQASLLLANAAVSSAQAQLAQAQRDFDRLDALFKAGNATRAQFEQAQAALDSAKAAQGAAQSQQSSAAEVLSYVDLKASADGIVLLRAMEPGQVVGAGQTVLSLAQDGPRDAVFNVYEAALSGVPHNVPVDLTLVADPSITATGAVREVSPTVNTATGTVRIEVGFDDPKGALPLGAAIAGSIALPPVSGFALPWGALFRDKDGPAVWVVDPSAGTVSLKPVIVDRYLADKVILASGLDAGDLVVTSGTQMLHPGEAVTAMEVTP
ncbi:acriflavin resistance protein [Devosia yakushimensis]|uniref:Acriflavin resistance protein n=1 Tax=Devosia yakushimensis TaxID=470028 RepID=A0ABQ5UGJ3_9HYPH|nr:efflux RND transporter periplasmic adaptor subunit [Devosia yakushimensis]GLQ11183.1 acriflavin resistance protein [Devosia yakushimensis]